MRAVLAGLIVAVLVVAAGLALIPGAKALTPRPGTYVDEINWFQQADQSLALKQVAAGQMDIYEFQLRTITDITSAKTNPNVRTIDTSGSLNNLFLNPVPINQSKAPGKLNPFAQREVREAVNYLIDRKFIADQIFGGAAIPHTTLWWSQHPEYARLASFFIQEERAYSYNPDKAMALISEGMAKAGATMENGKWMFNGQPVNINLIQRTEDARFDIGKYVADRFAAAGFQVTLVPKSGGGAFAIVYNGPPDDGSWQAYTEGWAVTALVAWADTDPFFYFNGGEGSNIWNIYKPENFPEGSLEKQLAEVSDKLFTSSYRSLEEREALIQQAVDLSLKNSVRVWLVAGATFASSTRLAGPGVGFVYDLAGGPWSFFSTRTARLSTADPDGVYRLKVGQRIMFLSSWNPWRGFGWLYDALQAYAFTDVAVFPHPHTGLFIPVRSQFEVTTAGPDGKLDVPSDAIIWTNDGGGGFRPVGSGVQATSAVKFTYTFGKWHDGTDINMNDVLHELSLFGRFAPGGGVYGASDGDIYRHDSDAQSPAILLFNSVVRAYKVLDDHTLVVYGNFWHVDSSTIANTFAVWPTVPWEVAELAMAPVLSDQARISEDSAANAGLPALDLTKGDSIPLLDTALANYRGINEKAPGMADMITDSEATARWAAITAFKGTYGHYFVSNGPTVLTRVDVANSQTTMTRFVDYPFMSDRWDSLLVPRVPSVQILTPPQIILGTGLPTNVTVRTTLGATPYDDLDMSWIVTSPSTGAVLFSGAAVKTGSGQFTITMTPGQIATLEPGAYTLATITVGHEAAIPVLTTTSIVAVSSLDVFTQLLGTETAKLQGQINDLQSKLSQAQNAATSAQNLANTLLAALIVAIVVAVIAIAISVVSVRSFNRRLAQITPMAPGALPAQMEERR